MDMTPFLLFDGNCAVAMRFYHACLGGDLSITKLGGTPMAAEIPGTQHDKVVHAYLKSGAIEFSATDWLHPTRRPQYGNTVGLYVRDGTDDELRALFDKLAVGADEELLDDLRPMPFGTYGHLVDVFGVQWFFRGLTPPNQPSAARSP